MSNAIELISKARLNKAKSLDLGNCGLAELPGELFELRWLEKLILSDRYYNIAEQEWLYSANSGARNKLVSIGDLPNRLSNLEELILGDSEQESILTMSGFLWKSSSLSSLLMQNCVIDDYSFLCDLPNLKNLDLWGNRINDASFLNGFTSLKSLLLGRNSISDYAFLKNMPYLESLNLWGNQLSDTSFLDDLRGLLKLNLGSNTIKDVSFVSKLTKLESLNLWGNNIEDISALSKLVKLQTLNLGGNKISNASVISRCIKLESLTLRDNHISDFSFIQILTDLRRLDLAGNRLTKLSFIFKLPNLQLINLEDNKIKILPAVIVNYHVPTWFEKTEEIGLLLAGNPIEDPPIEIAKQGNSALKAYFAKIGDEGKEYLYEAKLLILGEGGAGKTTFCNKIINPNFSLDDNEMETTEGIDIHQYNFKDGKGRSITLNIWDFGGQQIYHATHQFFLTRRSLYALVVDERKEDLDMHYWLQIVSLLSNSSPLIIVQNEKFGRKRDIDLRGLQDRFKNIKEITSVDFASNRGLERLLEQIQYHTGQLEHIGTSLPKSWLNIREELQQKCKRQNYIEFSEFRQLCKGHKVTDFEEQNDLSGIFHDIGIHLHYIDNPVLSHMIILNPEWVTDAVYQVLDHPLIRDKKKGRFNIDDLKSIWSDENYREVHHELLEIMKKFDLCYEIGKSKKYISPQLLSAERPANLNWNVKKNLRLRYVYEFMPKGIITRFIVQMHHLVKSQELVWKTGVLLSMNKSEAMVTETYASREILVETRGSFAKELMTVVTNELDKINNYFSNLKVEKMIPCICKECTNESNKYYYNYESLIRRRERGKLKIECDKSFLVVDVMQLLDNFFVEDYYDENSKSNAKRRIALLVASSSELVEERDKIVNICHKINKTLPKHYYEVVKWETDIQSGNTPGRVQDSINKKLGDVDVILVIFYSKVGKFTLEEFNLGLDKNKKIYVYFKDGFSPSSKAELDAYSEVIELHKKLKKTDRCISKTFEDLKNFDNEISHDLSLYIAESLS